MNCRKCSLIIHHPHRACCAEWREVRGRCAGGAREVRGRCAGGAVRGRCGLEGGAVGCGDGLAARRLHGGSGLLNTGIKVIHHELSEVQPDYSSSPPCVLCRVAGGCVGGAWEVRGRCAGGAREVRKAWEAWCAGARHEPARSGDGMRHSSLLQPSRSRCATDLGASSAWSPRSRRELGVVSRSRPVHGHGGGAGSCDSHGRRGEGISVMDVERALRAAAWAVGGWVGGGAVWCGVVWCGVVRRGAVWCHVVCP